MELINKVEYNITFGYEGPICQAFSKNNMCYISKLKHNILDDYSKLNNNIYIYMKISICL